jgi:hypothetical protein
MESSVTEEKNILTDEVWVRHCSKSERISNSAVRPDKSKSMLAAIIDNEGNFVKMKTGDGDNILDLLRRL